MDRSKPWYKSITLWGIFFALVGHLLQGGDVFGSETQGMVSDILMWFGLTMGGVGRVRASTKISSEKVMSDARGFARLPILCGLAIAAWLFVGCVHTFKCKESGTVKLKVRPDGSATLVAPCDGDDEAVRIEWKTFDKLSIQGLRPVTPPEPNGRDVL